MNKKDVYSFLGFDTEPSVEELLLRKKQLTAFWSADKPDSVQPLAKKVGEKLHTAAKSLNSSTKEDANNDDNQKPSNTGHSNDKTVEKKPKSFLFPNPVETAGAMFSSSWWKVYERVALLGLAAIGAGFLLVPHLIPKFEPGPPPNVRNYEKLEPTDPKSNVYEPIGAGTVEAPPELTPELRKELNPEPNSHPLIIKPTQAARTFIFSLLAAIQSGADLKNFVVQPMDASVVDLIGKTHLSVSFNQLPSDAIQVVSEDAGQAIVRVNEMYFTGDNVLSDYYLKSDNGTWKLSEVKEATSQ